MTRGRTAVATVVVAVTAAAALLAGCAPGSDEAFSLGTGTGPLPEATFTDLLDPTAEVSTADWRGTPTVVNFWATWCTFCLEEMPALQAASEQLGDRVRFVGIDRQDPREDALAFLADTGVTYDQVASPDGGYYEQVGARGMPTTLFVDADGVVVFRHTGPLDEEQTLDLVAEHLDVVP